MTTADAASTPLLPTSLAVPPRADDVPAGTASAGRLAALAAAAFLPPWFVWGSAIAQAHGLIGWHAPQGLALWSMLPACLVATLLVAGRAGLRDVAGRAVRARVGVGPWLAALLGPIALTAVALAVTVATGHRLHVGEQLALGPALAYLGYGTGVFLLTEEAVWRGLLLPRLQARFAPWVAALGLGVVWALWHVPLLHVPQAGDAGLPDAGFPVLVIATSVLITALVNAARGSVLLAAVMHASLDACDAFTGVVGPDHAAFWSATVVTSLAAAALLVATRGGLLARPAGTNGEKTVQVRPRFR